MRSWRLLVALALALAAVGSARPLPAQSTGRLTGIVTNEQGQPVASASVVLKGTRIGTLTGSDGRYLIPGIPAGSQTLVATLLGYGDATREVNVVAAQTTTANFQLLVKAVQLEGIVAVGYGTQNRRTVTGAVQTVKAAQLTESATSDPMKALQGRVAGVEAVANSNLPGAAMNVRIRGVRSLTANNAPLYVVDGIPISSDLSDFDPSNIQSIDILKDASATAIYGSRGANGVVLVTTKTGSATSAARTQFTMDGYAGYSRPLQLVDMMNMDQYLAMLQAAARYAGVSDAVNSVLYNDQMRQAYASGVQTDWQKAVIRTGRQQNFQAGLSGITGNTRFNISANYFDQAGLTRGQDYNRVTGTLSVDHTKGRLRLGVTANGSRSVQNQGQGNGFWGAMLAQTGFGAALDSLGGYIHHPDGEPLAFNPLRAQEAFLNQFTRSRLFASGFVDFKLLDGLNYRLNVGPDLTHVEHGQYVGDDVSYPATADARGSLATQSIFEYTVDNMLQLNRDFGSAHHLDGTLLYSQQRSRTSSDSAAAQQLPVPAQRWFALAGGRNFGVLTNLSEWSLESFMGRLSYTLLGRYTVSGAVRRDGSSRLAQGHKWATFPSLGLAWQLGDERFMKGLDFLTALKLRGSYGVTGNTAILPYQTQGALIVTNYNFGTGSGNGFGANPGNPANPLLSWEKTYQRDAALDFGLFNNRITGTIDYYRQDTKDLIQARTLPATAGYTGALQNVGETRNQGVELSLSTVNLDNWHGIRWTSDINWSRNRNKITKLASLSASGCPAVAPLCDLNNGWFVGYPINIGGVQGGGQNSPRSPAGATGADGQRRVYYDYRFDGIWQLGQEAEARSFGSTFKPGEIRIADIDGDGRITTDDQTIIGNTYPQWTASLYNRFTWKSLDLSGLITARWGYTVFDQFNAGANGAGVNLMQGRMGNVVTDYWTSTNPSNTRPAPRLNGTMAPYYTSLGYVDASHWRIRNITLGYTLPQGLAGRVSADHVRIYATAQDPFFFSDYKGYDPENATAVSAPSYRTLLVGASVGW